MKNFLVALLVAASMVFSSPAVSSGNVKLEKKVVKTYSRVNIDSSRTVVLKGSITSWQVDPVINKMIELDAKGESILLVINTPGGSIVAGDRLITTMRDMESPVICVVDGNAYSMGAIISLYCDKLYATENADFLFHEASLTVGGSTSLIKARYEHFMKWIETYNRSIAEKLDMSLSEYKKRIHNEWWMTAREAAEYGLVDGLVQGLKYPTVERRSTFFFFSWMNNQKNENDIWLCGPTSDPREECYGKHR